MNFSSDEFFLRKSWMPPWMDPYPCQMTKYCKKVKMLYFEIFFEQCDSSMLPAWFYLSLLCTVFKFQLIVFQKKWKLLLWFFDLAHAHTHTETHSHLISAVILVSSRQLNWFITAGFLKPYQSAAKILRDVQIYHTSKSKILVTQWNLKKKTIATFSFWSPGHLWTDFEKRHHCGQPFVFVIFEQFPRFWSFFKILVICEQILKSVIICEQPICVLNSFHLWT